MQNFERDQPLRSMHTKSFVPHTCVCSKGAYGNAGSWQSSKMSPDAKRNLFKGVCAFCCCFYLKSSDSSRERSEARLWPQASFSPSLISLKFFCEHKAPLLKKKSRAGLLPVASQPCHSSELNLHRSAWCRTQHPTHCWFTFKGSTGDLLQDGEECIMI